MGQTEYVESYVDGEHIENVKENCIIVKTPYKKIIGK